MLATAFGPSNTYLLLHLMYGTKYSATEAPTALALYCPYILLLAANGILESFVHAVSQVHRPRSHPHQVCQENLLPGKSLTDTYEHCSGIAHKSWESCKQEPPETVLLRVISDGSKRLLLTSMIAGNWALPE